MRVLRILMRLPRLVWFGLWFLWELTAANALVAWEVLTPRHHMRPGIVAVPTNTRSELETMWLANLISLTPGTLTLDVSEDQSVLYIHGLHIVTPDHLRERVQRFEQKLLKAIR